jgi:predicted nucleic acid-binding protein
LALQALAEFFAIATRKKDVSAESAIEFVDAMHAVRDHRIGFWDAMLWAVAREAGCRYLLSGNFQPGRTLEGVTFVNPFAPDGLPGEVERALGDG